MNYEFKAAVQLADQLEQEIYELLAEITGISPFTLREFRDVDLIKPAEAVKLALKVLEASNQPKHSNYSAIVEEMEAALTRSVCNRKFM
ncbi:MAG: hypothetical protein LC664_16700 [Flavobacteriales bacterium]|nr:hypothetical protein [Flavobacteriales bacterium]